MIFYPITTSRLHELSAQWGKLFARYRGSIPTSLGLVHMQAETKGNPNAAARSTVKRTVGLMRLPIREVLRLGFNETAAKDPELNIALWCKLTNQNADQLHHQFQSWWTTPNLDFWAGVRLVAIMGLGPTTTLLTTANKADSSCKSIAAVQQWINHTAEPTQRFGTINYYDLQQIADHLDSVRNGMAALNGPNYISDHFSSVVNIPITSAAKEFTSTQALSRTIDRMGL